MVIPVPKSKLSELQDEVLMFANAISHWDDYDRFAFKRILARVDDFAKVDAVASNRLRAYIYSAIGQFDKFDAQITNMLHNNARHMAYFVQLLHHSIHFHGSKTLALLPRVIEGYPGFTLQDVLDNAFRVGAFQFVANQAEKITMENASPRMIALSEVAKQAVKALSLMGVGDDHVVRMVDVFGALLDERRLTASIKEGYAFAVSPEFGGPSLLMSYYVDLTPADAAELNWDLTDRLVEKNLANLNVSFNIVGTQQTELQAA